MGKRCPQLLIVYHFTIANHPVEKAMTTDGTVYLCCSSEVPLVTALRCVNRRPRSSVTTLLLGRQRWHTLKRTITCTNLPLSCGGSSASVGCLAPRCSLVGGLQAASALGGVGRFTPVPSSGTAPPSNSASALGSLLVGGAVGGGGADGVAFSSSP